MKLVLRFCVPLCLTSFSSLWLNCFKYHRASNAAVFLNHRGKGGTAQRGTDSFRMYGGRIYCNKIKKTVNTLVAPGNVQDPVVVFCVMTKQQFHRDA